MNMNAPQPRFIRAYPLIGKVADLCLWPIMRLATGSLREAPQETHAWNLIRLTDEEIGSIDRTKVFVCEADRSVPAYRKIFFHLPVLGGWRRFIVLKPRGPSRRYRMGWILGTPRALAQMSRLDLQGPVRLLIWPADTVFFAFDQETGEQIPLHEVGRGTIGDGGPWQKTRLL
jgi:hypothetical protein